MPARRRMHNATRTSARTQRNAQYAAVTLVIVLLVAAWNIRQGSSGSAHNDSTSQTTTTRSVTRTTNASSASTIVDNTSWHVSAVADGDTFTATNAAGESQRIRVIGIDTPETKHPTKGVQCFGTEASAQATLTLLNSNVVLTYDDAAGRIDKYDRTLAYVALPDGSDFGAAMLLQGFAVEYTYQKAYANRALYKDIEANAKATHSGLWSACTGDPTGHSGLSPS